MSTFITRCETSGDGVTIAVKDLIDVEGVPTTAGSRALADIALPATADAECLAGARAAGARIVGKANLHELALGSTGKNPWFGTPVNPLDPSRIPGGSSSGCAVAVATGEADIGFGTDTGGSVRIPAACTGTAGLKTTRGRIPLGGTWPLSPTFDTIGPMARDVGGLVDGMALLEPGFTVATWSPQRVGRLRYRADPVIDDAVDVALAATGWAVDEAKAPDWDTDPWVATLLLIGEAWDSDRDLIERWPDAVSSAAKARAYWGRDLSDRGRQRARVAVDRWTATLTELFDRYDLLVLPTMALFPPTLEVEDDVELAANAIPVNMAGVPALALPVPARGSAIPPSLQLIGPRGSEDRLLAAGLEVEAAVGKGPFAS